MCFDGLYNHVNINKHGVIGVGLSFNQLGS